MRSVHGASRCGQWALDLLDYLIMQYLYLLVILLFGSLIPTFCSIFVNYFLFLCVFFLEENFSIYNCINSIGKVFIPGFISAKKYVGYTLYDC